jgi:WD40 repeat protein
MSGTLRVGGGGWRGAGAPRFSLLDLDDGEDYVLDVAGSMTAPPPAKTADESGARPWWRGKVRGRVRLLTKSLVFEPADASAPVAKFAFAGVTRLEAVGTRRDAFELVCSKMALVRGAGDADAPRAAPADALAPWRFEVSVDAFAKLFEPASGLLKVARQTPSVAEATLAAMRSRREDRARFDANALLEETERVAFDAPAARMTPLVREPGRLVITDARVYFQPLAEIHPVEERKRNEKETKEKRKSLLCDARDVVAVARRTHATRPLGVEFFFFSENREETPSARVAASEAEPREEDPPPSALFTLRTEDEREACVAAALAAADRISSECESESCQTLLRNFSARLGSALAEASPNALAAATELWRLGDLTTLDYLVYLNVCSGRSHSDLAQWPVMPWVLRDYRSAKLDLNDFSRFRDLSRPVGALEPERLGAFRERARQMREATGKGSDFFLYGTHYSAPGYVLYWLLRSDPKHHLRLQNGAFDAPDRLFHGVENAFDGALRSTADVKELVPEFFCGPSDFLVNKRSLKLGIRQVDDEALGDVVLPPWAQGSPDVFILKHREALESEPVSAAIHKWIDLVFGYTQTGLHAEKADNAFHPLTYQGAAQSSLEATKDPVQRRALEAQIQEFGRAPRRLFAQPHPPRDAKKAREKWMARRENKTETRERGAAERARDVLATLAATLEATLEPFFEKERTATETKAKTEEGEETGLDDVSDEDVRAPAAVADETNGSPSRGEEKSRRGEDDATFFKGQGETNDDAFSPDTAFSSGGKEEEEEEKQEETRDDVSEPPTCRRTGPPRLSLSWRRRGFFVAKKKVVGLGFSRDGAFVLGACAGARVTCFASVDGSLEFASVAPGPSDVGPAETRVTCTSFALMSALATDRPIDKKTNRQPNGKTKNPYDLVGFPAALVGCGDGGVYAYGAEYGRVLGRLDAFSECSSSLDEARVEKHSSSNERTNDAVSAMAVPSARDDVLFAASRGGVVRVWDIATGRRVGSLSESKGVSGAFRSASGLASGAAAVIGGRAVRSYTSPTRGVLPSARRAGPKTHTAELALGETFRDVPPLAESTPTFRELALDCDARGELVVVGGAGGEVTAWDPRCARAAWVAEAFSRRDTENASRSAENERAIRGVSLAKDGGVSLTVACADGFARVLDLRKCGDLCDTRFVGVGGLTCSVASECAKDVVYVGGEDGRVAELDWSKEDGATFFYDARTERDDLDAFLSGVDSRNFFGETRDGKSPGVSCLSVAPGGGALAAGWDDGTVAVFAEK